MPLHPLAELFLAPPWWFALSLAAILAGLCWYARLLTASGALSTLIVGFVIFGLGGGRFVVPLLFFFFSSSLLSLAGRKRKAQASRHDAKGATRDAAQVWANGGMAVAVTLAFAYYATRWPAYRTRYLALLFLAALATVNADTWATEIGKLAKWPPRLLTNWQPVAPGTSGAVSWKGLFGALLGAAAIPLSAYTLWGLNAAEILAITWAGFMGSLIDSVLGATLQAKYRDTVTGELTERAQIAGRKTKRVQGFAWINNDMVNFFASAGGVLCTWILFPYNLYRGLL